MSGPIRKLPAVPAPNTKPVSEMTDAEVEAAWRARKVEPDPLQHWNLMTAEQIFAPLPPYPWLIPGLHIAPGRVTLLNGYANAGKTIVAMSIALAVAASRPVWGLFNIAKPGKVLHMNGEIGTYIARERYQRLARGLDIDPASLVDNLVLANYPRAHLDEEAFEGELVRACTGFSLVIVDSLRAFSGSFDENAKEIGIALLMLARVSDRTGATIMVLHHNRKPSKDDDAQAAALAISGSSSIFGGCECAFVMAARDKGGPVYVKHERSPIGTTLSDFGLSFEDVAQEGNPRWGLRVVHLEAEQLAECEAASARAKENVTMTRNGTIILETMAKSGGRFRGSREAFRAACSIGKGPFIRTLAELVAERVVTESGTYHAPEWHIAGFNDPDSSVRTHSSPPSPESSGLSPKGVRDDDDRNAVRIERSASNEPPLEARGNLFKKPE